MITMAYVVFEGSLIGIFSFFFKDLAQVAFPRAHPLARARAARCWCSTAC